MKKRQCSNADVIEYQLDTIFPKEIIAQSFIIEFSNKEYIQRQDSEVAYVYQILRGKAKILRLAESGKQLILQFIEEGAFIGELTLVGSETQTKDVEAIGDVLCIAVPFTIAKSTLMSDNHFVCMIAKYIGDKVLSREKHFSSLQAYEVKYRLAEVMLTTSINDIYAEKQVEIAEYLGISYRHMLYTIKWFKDHDYITKTTKGYRINREMLNKLLLEMSE